MPENKDYNKTSVLIVGAGPAGLAAAIRLKSKNPDAEICVIDKADQPGNHNLSGAVLEPGVLHRLLDEPKPDWDQSDQAKQLLGEKIDKDNVVFLLGKGLSINIFFAMKIAKALRINFGQMIHLGDYAVSISKLTKYLASVASEMGVEVLNGFAASEIILDESKSKVECVKLVDQGLDREGNKQPNYLQGEKIYADFVLLAEGCDGLLTEQFVNQAGLERKSPQLYSVGVKEIIKVTSEQYNAFTATRVVHAMGYPIWTPVLGPGMFGGGIMYPVEDEHIAVGMIVGADWKYRDFNPQDALTLFKRHKFVNQYIEDGTVVEAGAKMIPEGGFYAIPRDPHTGSIGKGNCLLLGDSAGFVNMLKIKGLHNAIDSGIFAADAVAKSIEKPHTAATAYTELVNNSNITKEMLSAKNFRQTVAKFGPLFGMPLSVLGSLLPKFNIEKDYEAMQPIDYKYKGNLKFDKDTFTAMASTEHREEEPSHLTILDSDVCKNKCTPSLKSPCITFCPAGVYETIHDVVKPANPSNCLHCKTCQRKCPFDNIRWTVPEGSGGPRYRRM